MSKVRPKYPKIFYKNMALYKAVSLLPTNTNSNLPAIYLKSLPMIIGVAVLIVIIILPTTRNASFNFIKNTSSDFATKTSELKSNLALSLNTGISAYINQIENHVEILPIDSQLESKNYLGRVEVDNISKIEARTIAEKAHFMTASIAQSFQYLK